MNIKKTIIIFFSLAFIGLNTAIIYAAPKSPDIDADAYVLMDASTGRILCEKNPDANLYPASTTKIMTAIIALENGKLDQKMTTSQDAIDAIGPGGMNIGLMPGEELTLEELLNALLVRSANETAYIIADNLCPTRQDFVDLMNKKAAEIGATNTNFVNPCGMDLDKPAEKHLTTASDLAKIAFYAMKIPKFREIVGKQSCTIGPTNKHAEAVTLTSTNKLITNDIYNPYPLSVVTGVKTGFTEKAGHNLVSSAKSNTGAELISVILGVKNQSADKIFAHSKELLEFGFKNFSPYRIVSGDSFIKTIPVSNSSGVSALALVAEKDLNVMIPSDEVTPNIERSEYIKSSISAPITKGTSLGYVEYKVAGQTVGKVNVVAAESISKINVLQVLLGVAWRAIQIIAMIVLAFVLLRCFLKNLSRKVNTRC